MIMTTTPLNPQQILDKAIELAQQSSWGAFALPQLASSLDCRLVEIKHHFRSKDDMAETFFDRADEAMLQLTTKENYAALPADERLLQCIMRWFDYLAPYKGLVREMLGYKLEPGHFHLQAHGITRVSRTVQWFLAAAGCEHRGLSRITNEIALTTAYLATLTCFMSDHSKQHSHTRALLKRLIPGVAQVNRLAACLNCRPTIGGIGGIGGKQASH